VPDNGAKRKCKNAIQRVQDELSGIDVYDIYADVCVPKRAKSRGEALLRHLYQIDPDSLLDQAVFLTNTVRDAGDGPLFSELSCSAPS
jgi:hypothetical protein